MKIFLWAIPNLFFVFVTFSTVYNEFFKKNFYSIFVIFQLSQTAQIYK